MEQPPALSPLARELENERRKNAIIQQLSLVLNRPAPLKEKLDTILEVLDDRFGLRHTMLLLPDPDQPRLQVFSSRGFGAVGIGAIVKFGEGIIGVVALRRKKLRLANISRARIYYSLMADKQPTGPEVVLPGLPNVESQLALPLLVNDELIAVLSAESTDLNFFSPEDEEFLMTLSQLIALSIQNAVVMERLEQKVRERTAALEVQKQELERANASKDRLFAIIGHDLRSPAASLQSTAQLMHQPPARQPAQLGPHPVGRLAVAARGHRWRGPGCRSGGNLRGNGRRQTHPRLAAGFRGRTPPGRPQCRPHHPAQPAGQRPQVHPAGRQRPHQPAQR
jgi:GAF domain-containing protein